MLLHAPVYCLMLDDVSREKLHQFRNKLKVRQTLSPMLTYGLFSDVFTGHGPLDPIYDITAKEWCLYAEAMKTIPEIARSSLKREICWMVQYYEWGEKLVRPVVNAGQAEKTLLELNRKHKDFWMGMHRCL